MGILVTRLFSRKIAPTAEKPWYCSKCTAENPNSSYPTCLVCGLNDHNCINYHSGVSPKQLWQCDLCSFKNEVELQSCSGCGKKRLVQKKRELPSANTRVIPSARPKSVLVRDRRAMDIVRAEKLIKEAIAFCRQNKVTFVDDEFPPSDRSLGVSNKYHVMQWLPIANIAPSTDLDDGLPWTVFNTPEPSDIHQGELGDCWLLAALMLIAERPEMLEHILLTKTINREGVYAVRLCHNGIWQAVILDQYFPCTLYSRLAYSRAARRQLYVPLVEKACAKIFGSYESLSGGYTSEGLQLLTGAPCEYIRLQSTHESVDFDIIWVKLLSACESKLLIGASTGCSNIDKHVYRSVGLNPNHAFTVLVAKSLTVGEGRFLLLRDPHGTTHYSESSITQQIREHLSSIHVERPSFGGIFWIAWSSFLQFFDSITISTYVSNHFDLREQAEFTQSSTDPVSAYYFTVSKTSLVTVSLIYHCDSRTRNIPHTQSFVLCNVEEETSSVGNKVAILASSRETVTYWNKSLRPGAYVIIPFSISFWEASISKIEKRTRNYTLVIHSSVQLAGAFLSEPPTLLADCLIAATVTYCNQPHISDTSIIYMTPRSINVNIIIVENQLINKFLTFNMIMTQADNIQHSRHTFSTIDCIPPHHRQLICILEWVQEAGELGSMSYATAQKIAGEWHQATPTIAISQNDLHSPRPF